MLRVLWIALLVPTMFAQSREEAEARLKARMEKVGSRSAVKITVAESASGPMLVGETGSGEATQVVIERFVRTEGAPEKPRASLLLRPVFKEKQQVLDFLSVDGVLYVLGADRVIAEGRVMPMIPAAPMPRDARGRLIHRNGGVAARLPGSACTVSTTVTCRPDTGTWTEEGVEVAWAPGRNFLISPARPNTSFFAVAAVPGVGPVLSRTTGPSLFGGAGSDIASISASCSPAAIVALDVSGSIQAREYASNEWKPLTRPESLPGPVTALWRSENPAEVSVVVRNATTGDYEALRASVVCSR